MTDKELKRHKKRVQKHLRHWKLLLGLGAWKIDVDWYDGRLPDTDPDPYRVCLMDVDARWEYLTIDMRVNVDAISRLSDEALEAAVIHELCHALVCEMRDWDPEDGRHHEERVVSTLTMVMGWVRDHYRAEARP